MSFLNNLFGGRTPSHKPKAPAQETVDIDEQDLLPVRTDGIYCHIKSDEDGLVSNNAFRFFDNAGKTDNGAVLTVLLAQQKQDDGYYPKNSWFCWENNENEDGGRWSRKGNEIAISIELTRGTIRYKGRIEEERLILDSHSLITGFKESGKEYAFCKFEDVPGWFD